MLGCVLLAYMSFESRTGDNPILSWVLTLVFVACIPIMIAMIFRPAGLFLGPEGMTLRGLRSDRLYQWEDISKVRVQKMPGSGMFRSKRVWFNADYSDAGNIEKKLAFLTRGQGMLPSNFGYSADQMAEMILAFQNRALRRSSDEK